MNAPGVTSLVKRVLHLAPQREMPRLATESFAKWARSANVPSPGQHGRGRRRAR